MEQKIENSNLIPYKIVNGEVFVFLQKRDKNAKVLSDKCSFFGGKGEDNETPEQTLEREVKEELNFDVKNYSLLGKYDSVFIKDLKVNVYFTEVGDSFEKEIEVKEGEYGKFFSKEEVENEPDIIESDKQVIKDLYKKLKNDLPS